MTNPIVDPMVGRTVAHYEILAPVGGGGMGVVYKARDLKLGRIVALKFLPPQWSHDESARQRFLREAQAASATDHPNICTIHDIGTAADGQLFIVMAYCDGETLKRRLEQGPLPAEEALDIATQIADGLAKAHAQGVVHRDIKPGNVILTEDGVRILDFGLAKFADSLQLTVHGSTLGTAAYMAPEQVRGEDADARADVWAVGVVLYEMLCGHPPFRGGYPEAIAFAIRNDAPAPLRAQRPEIPEEVEQLVFRALHKEPAVRFQSGRELARALRQARGFTVPQDLRTQVIEVPAPAAAASARRSRTGRLVTAALVILLAAAPGAWFLMRPPDRVLVAVAPVTNETGYEILDPHEAALTYTLTEHLSQVPDIRTASYARMLEILRGQMTSGGGIASSGAVQALATHTGAAYVLVPTITYERDAWRARMELRDAATASVRAVFETPPAVSALTKETAYSLMGDLAGEVQTYFESRRTRALRTIESLVRARRTGAPPVRTLDAARSLEEGLSAYQELEHATAMKALRAAADQDRRSPVPLAWISRVAVLMGQRQQAAEAGDRALALASSANARDRLFIEAVAAEAVADFDTARERYEELAERSPDDPSGLIELASYLDRRGATRDATATYHRVLELAPSLLRPHLELCRLHNRSDDPLNAKAQAKLALDGYRAVGAAGGEGQALLCLVDALRVTPADQNAALATAEEAVRLFDRIGYSYNAARARNYVGLAYEALGRFADAVTAWEQALAAARAAGNAALESRVVLNLGVGHEALGNVPAAVDYYRESYALNEALGEQREAARSLANAGALTIEYGGNVAQGVRDVENALAVARSQGDRTFEIFCLQLLAAAHRYAGRHGDAEVALKRAEAVATSNGLEDEIATVAIDLARSRIDQGDYAAARTLLETAVTRGSARDVSHARIRLAQALARSGDTQAATAAIDQAAADVKKTGDVGLEPLLYLVLGEVAYEAGRAEQARAEWQRAALLARGEYPDPSTIEARANIALLAAERGRAEQAERDARAALDRARKTGRAALEARCRVILARILAGRGSFDAAVQALAPLPPGGAETIGPELQGLAHYWRGMALSRGGDAAAGATEIETGRRLLGTLQSRLPDRGRAFAGRPDIRRVLG